MVDYVINEWLWSDFSGENGPDRRRESADFIQAFVRSPHRAVVLQGSKFDEKAWRLCGSTDAASRMLGAYFRNSVRADSLKCRLLLPHEVGSIPEEIANRANPDDHYLVQAQQAVPGAVIVSTDAALLEVLGAAGIPCRHRDALIGELQASEQASRA